MKRVGGYVLSVSMLVSTMCAAQDFSEVSPSLAQDKGCLSCHDGIERFTDGAMMTAIEAMGRVHGDPGGCVVCHGGTPTATTPVEAHTGAPVVLTASGGADMFYPDPGSIWISDRTCGLCHAGYADAMEKSLMNTEAGKIQGNFWSWAIQDDYKVHYGNYALTDNDGQTPTAGSDTYKAYMLEFAAAHPDQMPTEIEQIPDLDVEAIPEHPNLAGITYSRQQCQRCHVGVTGREKRGDYRGTGCTSCHVPYGNEGLYEGSDPTISREQPGHPLVHRMQATRENKVTVGEVTYSGIPSETCNTCHNRGKRIGVSYQGIMEFPYGSPYDDTGSKQPPLHTKTYQFIKDDLHHQIESRPGNPEGGLLCQDCHTSIDMHGDGNIFGTTLAQVEIECTDCHGTPDAYPWELPLGYGEEFQSGGGTESRGLASAPPATAAFGTLYPGRDGYLLTARGNAFGNVVKDGDKVIVHSASGLDFESPVLKQIKKDGRWKSLSSQVAMESVGQHMESMECYACHADWAPQCYGCHITVDYSEGKTDIDWINNANSRQANGLTADAQLGTNGLTGPGKVSETRSYLRWETPILGINGEGRVSPLMPGCPVITTVIDKDGNTVANNVIWPTPEGKGMDHAAVQPHTAGRNARDCESCHDNPKSLGYGIEDGRFLKGYDKARTVDLETADGEIIPGNTQVQMQAVPALPHDLSQIITRDDEQLVSIGSHWPLTGPLSKDMRRKMERTGLCMGCHQNMTQPLIWDNVAKPGWIDNEAHRNLMDTLLRDFAGAK
ncbi:MAG: cytochrome C [Woeseia sp.]